MTNDSPRDDGLPRVLAAHSAIGYDDVEGCECGAVVSGHEAHVAHVAHEIREHLARGTVTRWDVEVRADPDSPWVVKCSGLHAVATAKVHHGSIEGVHAKRIVRADRTPEATR